MAHCGLRRAVRVRGPQRYESARNKATSRYRDDLPTKVSGLVGRDCGSVLEGQEITGRIMNENSCGLTGKNWRDEWRGRTETFYAKVSVCFREARYGQKQARYR